MPASRSRTQNWRRTLEQVCQRNGPIEIAIPRSGGEDRRQSDAASSTPAVNLIWRVRLLAMTDDELLVEEPSTMGQRIEIQPNVTLVGVISLGQNRWMFRTRSLGRTHYDLNNERTVTALRLQAPTTVERCQRRAFYRVKTVGLLLPTVDASPLLNTGSVIGAETAVRTRIEMMRNGQLAGVIGEIEPILAPEIGPTVTTRLVNLGGGGAGLVIDAEDSKIFDKHRIFWLTMSLMPHVPAPLSLVARLSHIRMDSEQRRHLGMSFIFDHNRDYQHFVIETLCRCVNDVQREQLRRRAENE